LQLDFLLQRHRRLVVAQVGYRHLLEQVGM
jgi:hypothetical protein